jgi:hypothetical protein
VPVLAVDLAALDLGGDDRQANLGPATGPISGLELGRQPRGVERGETLPPTAEQAVSEHVFDSSRWL